MKISCEYLLRYYLKFLKYTGGFGETKYQTALFFFVLLVSCSGIPQLIPVLEATTWNHGLQDLAYPVEFFSTIIKASIYFKNRKTILLLIFLIDSYPEYFAPPKEQFEIMKNATRKFMRIFKTYTMNACFGMSSILIIKITQKEFMVNSDFGVTCQYSNPLYWIVCFGLYLTMFTAALMAITIDALPAAIYSGIMMRIQILQHYVSEIGTYNDFNTVLKEKLNKDRIKTSSIEYLKIWQLVKMAEASFNGILLTQIILSFLIVSTALYQMSGVRLNFLYFFHNFSL